MVIRFNLNDPESLQDAADDEIERLTVSNIRNRMAAKGRRAAERENDRANGRRNGGGK